MTAKGTRGWGREEIYHQKLDKNKRENRGENASVVITLWRAPDKRELAFLLYHQKKESGMGFLMFRMKEIGSIWQEKNLNSNS